VIIHICDIMLTPWEVDAVCAPLSYRRHAEALPDGFGIKCHSLYVLSPGYPKKSKAIPTGMSVLQIQHQCLYEAMLLCERLIPDLRCPPRNPM